MAFKVSFNDDIRRFTLEAPSFANLQARVVQAFRVPDFRITWRDVDGDDITIASADDLALVLVSENTNPLRLRIIANSTATTPGSVPLKATPIMIDSDANVISDHNSVDGASPCSDPTDVIPNHSLFTAVNNSPFNADWVKVEADDAPSPVTPVPSAVAATHDITVLNVDDATAASARPTTTDVIAVGAAALTTPDPAEAIIFAAPTIVMPLLTTGDDTAFPQRTNIADVPAAIATVSSTFVSLLDENLTAGSASTGAEVDHLATKVDELKDAGNKAFQAGDFRKAVSFFDEAIAHDSANAVLFSNRAAAFIALECHEAAHADAVKTVALRPDWAKGYCRLGVALHGLGKLEASLQAYADGLQYEPTNTACKDGMANMMKLLQGKKESMLPKGEGRNPPPSASTATATTTATPQQPRRVPSLQHCGSIGRQVTQRLVQRLHEELETVIAKAVQTDDPNEFNIPQRVLYFARPFLQGGDVAWLQSGIRTRLSSHSHLATPPAPPPQPYV